VGAKLEKTPSSLCLDKIIIDILLFLDFLFNGAVLV
jgi:hypothetical protein